MNVFVLIKTSSENEDQSSLQDVFIKTNVYWVFSTLTLNQIFLKTKFFFTKLEYRFLVECITIEKGSFPYKTAISEANVETNRIVTTKWAYHRELSFTSNYFIFLKVFVSV